MTDPRKDIENSIAGLQAIRLFMDVYASSEPTARLSEEVIKALRTGGLLSKNIATAIEAWLANKSVTL
jgi:hypothetical protein